MTPNTASRPSRILLIDDNEAIHEDFRKILGKKVRDQGLLDMEATLFGQDPRAPESSCFEVDSAYQGKDGLERIRQAQLCGRPYALAFVDGRMPPGWDGVETIKHIWQESPDIQVVLCTAYADYSWQEIHRVLGMSDSLLILKKPFDNIEVLQLSHALTRKWGLTREARGRIKNLGNTVRKETAEREHLGALLRAALEHSPAGLVISDARDGSICWASRSAQGIPGAHLLYAQMDGIACDRAEGQVLHPNGRAYEHEELPLSRAVKGGEIVTDEEVNIRTTEGRDVWISCNAAPIRGTDGTITAAILVLQDVTQRKKSEKERDRLHAELVQAQRMESIGLLAGGVAHDFNNMLCVILGNVELGVEVTNEADPVRPALSEIRMAAERSADLTNQLLAFARKQVALPQVLDLNHKISATLKMLRRVIGERIDVRWEPGSVVWPVRCDPAQVDQILTNLLLNARDAIEGVGQITVKVQNSMLGESVCSIHADVLPGPYVEVGVSDSGKGMDERTLAQVFQPFFTTKEMGRGTGLGLATVYGIVKQNDGHITVSSEPGKGSHFSVYLPRFTGDVIEPTVAVLRAVPKGRGEMILVVEDERRLLNLAEKMLKKLGYTPIVADLPSDALHKAKTYSGEIRLLVSDLMMPEMNGRELMQSIRNVIPGLRCVLTSGYPAQIVAQGDELDEGVYFMQKPYSMSDLSGAVHRALEGVSS